MTKLAKRTRLGGKLALLVMATCCTAAYADRIKAVHPRYDVGDWHTNATAWADGNAPDSTKDYLLDMNGYNANGTKASAVRFGGNEAYNTFGGKSLQLGEVGGGYAIFLYNCGNNQSLEFPRDGFVLAKGQLTSWIDADPHTINIGGTVTVISPRTAPFPIIAQKKNQIWNFKDKLVSSENARLDFYMNNGNTTCIPTWYFGFDGSEYLGDIVIGWGEANKIANNATTAVSFRNNGSCAGHIFLNPSLGRGIGFQSTTTAYTNGTMTVRGNQTITVNNNGSMAAANVNSILVVTNSLTVDEGSVIGVAASDSRINDWKQYADGQTVMPFLTVPQDSNATVDNFRPAYTNTIPYGNVPFVPRHDIVVTTNLTEATKTFALRRRMYGQVEGTGVYYPDPERNDLFTFGSVHTECDYFNKQGAIRTFFTPDVENAIYAAKSLTLRAANDLCVVSRTLTVDDLRLIGTSTLFPQTTGTYVDTILYGRLGIWDSQDGVHVVAQAGCTADSVRTNMEIASNVWGPGDLEVVSKGGGKGGTLTLSGNNAEWTGGVSVTGQTTQAIVVKFASAEAQGAPLAAFRADAVKLNAYGYLSAGDGVTLADSTRGITAAGGGLFAEAGTSFAIREKITFAAPLVKKGGGTVALGCEPDVSGGNAALDVQEGYVKPLETNCLAGVALSFAQGTALMMEVPEAGAEGVGRYGIVNPTLAAGATLRVKVPFASEPQTVGGKLTVPICTVAAASANAMKGRIAVEKPWKSFVGKVGALENGDGTVTLVTEIIRSGMCIILR